MLLQELCAINEAKDPATAILSRINSAVKSLGFSPNSAGDTPGVKRKWLIQKNKLYHFNDKESVQKFMDDLSAKLEGMKLKVEHKTYSGGEDHIYGDGFQISTQNGDRPGQIVISVPKGNKSGDLYRMGIDA